MGPISASTVVDATRERAVEVVTDLALRPAFTDHFISDYRLERLDATGEGAGARFRVKAPLNHVWMEMVVAEVDSPHRVVEHGSCGRGNRIPVHGVWELTEGPGAVTTVRLTFWTEPTHALDRIRELAAGSGPWYGRQWRRGLRRLRDLVEGGEGDSARVGVAGADRLATR